MPNRINILNELKELGSVLASLPPVPAYKVPAGYFEAFPATMLELVTVTETVLSPSLQQAKSDPYHVPLGYFEELADRLLARAKAADAAPKEEIELISPLLSKLDKKLPFAIPGGYFNELTDNAVAGAMAIEFTNEELENLSALMTSLRSRQIYEVPVGYFEQLPAQVMENIRHRQPARVVSFHFAKKAMRYAAAAVIAGVIAVGGWFYLHNGTPNTAGLAGNGAPSIPGNISAETLQIYLEGLNTTAPDPNYANTSSADIKESDMKEMLVNISDEELQRYAEQYSVTKPAMTN